MDIGTPGTGASSSQKRKFQGELTDAERQRYKRKKKEKKARQRRSKQSEKCGTASDNVKKTPEGIAPGHEKERDGRSESRERRTWADAKQKSNGLTEPNSDMADPRGAIALVKRSPSQDADATISDARTHKRGPAIRKRRGKRKHRGNVEDDVKNGGDVVSEDSGVAPRSGWNLSEPVGGRFLDGAPRMSSDEQYLICATESKITAYATATSLPHQTLMNEHMKDFFTSCDLSATEKNTAWACTHDGLVYRWNFVEGLTVLKRHVHGPVQSIKVEKSSTTGEDTIYTLGKSDSQWTLSSHGIIHNTLNHVVLKHKLPIRAFQIKEHGNVVVAITTSTLLVGTFNKAMTGETDPDYTWREIACTEPPTCFDVKSRKGTNGKWIVDVVVGGLRGCIFVFNDVLRRFEQVSRKDRIGSTSYIPREQQLHWHREAVGGVTWSLDGQYIVSGGKETVMVLWQLETGRKQFLPNLESPIQDIAVSPSGASYVVRLADNSVMVLSTSELSPTCHVASIQVNSFSRALLPTAHLPTVDLLHQFNAEASINQAAAIINPRSPEHLLMSCPAYQVNFSIGGPLTPAPYLQDFDIKNSVFVSRQALTRTNAINVNLGPEGNSILEPNVKCLQSSYDGRWLATIDEWYAPPADLKHLSVDEELDTPNTLECKLRFWAWDATSKQWMLNSRIDEPHRSDHEQSSQPVVALAADPISCKFSTLGVDSVVRTWVLKSKLKNGKIVRGEVGPDAKGKPRTVETWWSIEHSVPLEQAGAFDSLQSVHPDRGILAYSNDGSILAAYTHHDTFSDSSSTVHFIDTTTGHLHDTQTNLFSSPDGIHGLGFLDQYLIILGRSTAAVWDVTSFTLQHLISLTSEEISTPAYPRNPLPIPHLAINIPTHTFAIATPERSRTNRRLDVHPLLRYRTNLSIYSPISKEPVYRTTLPRTTMALISAGGIAGPSDGSGFEGHKKGYVVLDLGAEVRTVMLDTAGLNALPTPPPKSPEVIRQVPDAASQQLEAELLEAEENEDEEDDVSMVNPNDGDEDEIALPPKDVDARPVVRREQLAEVFNHPTLAMPAMGELFERVMGLYAEKPVVRSPALRGVDEEDDVDDTPLDEVVGPDSAAVGAGEQDEDDDESSESDSD